MTERTGRAAADAALVLQRLATLSEDTGMSMAELREMFLTEMSGRLERALAALASGDLPETVRLVHGAAGTTGICGAVGLAEDLATIEHLAAAGDAIPARQALDSAIAAFDLLASHLPEVCAP